MGKPKASLPAALFINLYGISTSFCKHVSLAPPRFGARLLPAPLPMLGGRISGRHTPKSLRHAGRLIRVCAARVGSLEAARWHTHTETPGHLPCTPSTNPWRTSRSFTSAMTKLDSKCSPAVSLPDASGCKLRAVFSSHSSTSTFNMRCRCTLTAHITLPLIRHASTIMRQRATLCA